MKSAALTVELPEEERMALEELSKLEGRPVGELVHEAIKSYLGYDGLRPQDLADTLQRLREYKKRDPDFSKAKAAFVKAELSFDDPLEGTAMRGEFVDGNFVPAGSALNKIRELLSA
jgi:predicted DNA-binding protein